MSRMQTINCPNCHEALTLPDEYAGRMVQCPRCENRFTAASTEFASGPAATPLVSSEHHDDGRDLPRPSSRRRRRYEDDYDDISINRGHVKPHRGGTILALGIIGFFFCGIILWPCAWVMGANDLKEMANGAMDSSGEGSTR